MLNERESPPSLSLLSSVLGVGSLDGTLRRQPQEELQWGMSQCLEHFVIIRRTWHSSSVRGQLRDADTPTSPASHCLCAYRWVPSSEKGSERKGKGDAKDPWPTTVRVMGVAPLQQTHLYLSLSTRKPLKKAGAVFMRVICISTCVQACTLTHSCASTLKYLQSAHMWVSLCVSPCAWEIRSCVWSCPPGCLHLWLGCKVDSREPF